MAWLFQDPYVAASSYDAAVDQWAWQGPTRQYGAIAGIDAEDMVAGCSSTLPST